MAKSGRLFMIPATIAEDTWKLVIPNQAIDIVAKLTYFLAEDVRSARRFLSSLKVHESIEALQFSVLNKDTTFISVEAMMAPIFKGTDTGVLSESGCPGIADPGSLAVDFAHRNNIQVIPLVGPSSILLALMASGLNGQQFVFNGYLPIEHADASRVIAEMERESKTKKRTQIFIETPYRNNTLLKNLLAALNVETKLCVAVDLTSPNEKITMCSVREWRLLKVVLPKRPAIFLFLA